MLERVQFIVLGFAGIAAAGYLFYGLALVLAHAVAETPLLFAALLPVCVLLLVIMRHTGVVDLAKVAISSLPLGSTGIRPETGTNEQHVLNLEAVRHMRFWRTRP